MAKSTGAETPAASAATGTPETPAATPAESGQEIVANVDVEAIKRQMAEAQAAIKALEMERNNAVANAIRADAQYKGLQSQTTKALQKAAQDRRDLAFAQMQAQEIGDIKQLLNTVVGKVLDEDSAKEFAYTQKELELKRREAALARPAETEPVIEPQQYTTPEDEKAQFLSYYFPGVDVKPSDPNIDWGVGASSTQEAFRRFTTSVLNIKAEMDSAKTNDAVKAMQTETATQLEALKAQMAELTSNSAKEVEEAKKNAAEQARKDAEKRLRAMGADVSGAAPSDGSGRKTIAQQMNESLNDNLLTTKKGQQEYQKNLDSINQAFREKFRQG